MEGDDAGLLDVTAQRRPRDPLVGDLLGDLRLELLVALDRLGWASERASDPCLAAVRQYFGGLVYFREGEYTIGLRLIRSGQGFLGPADESREALTVASQLQDHDQGVITWRR